MIPTPNDYFLGFILGIWALVTTTTLVPCVA